MRDHGIAILCLAIETQLGTTQHRVYTQSTLNHKQFFVSVNSQATAGPSCLECQMRQEWNVEGLLSTASGFEGCCSLSRGTCAPLHTHMVLLTPGLDPHPMLTSNPEWRATIKFENRLDATKESEPAYKSLASNHAGHTARSAVLNSLKSRRAITMNPCVHFDVCPHLRPSCLDVMHSPITLHVNLSRQLTFLSENRDACCTRITRGQL